jgi:CheY-like chemotaxis protein
MHTPTDHAPDGPVLVVDDNPSLQHLLGHRLNDAGFETATASSGTDALAYLLGKNPRPCLIVLDIHMPEMDGAAFRAEQLRIPGIEDIPVILLTGVPEAASMAEALGAAACVVKPTDLALLPGLVSRHCIRRERSQL